LVLAALRLQVRFVVMTLNRLHPVFDAGHNPVNLPVSQPWPSPLCQPADKPSPAKQRNFVARRSLIMHPWAPLAISNVAAETAAQRAGVGLSKPMMLCRIVELESPQPGDMLIR